MAVESGPVAARERLYGYLVRTLRTLPAELALAVFHPELPRAVLGQGEVSFSADSFPEDGPQEPAEGRLSVSYWVTGTTPQSVGRCFDLFVACWTGFGWPVRANRAGFRTRAADVHTPDGYGLRVQRSVNGYLSVSGWTPVLPVGALTGDPFPPVVEHPSS